MLRALFKPRPAVEAGRTLFRAVCAQARRPVFYTGFGVADTVEGRFELYVLHLVLVLHRLKGERGEAAEVAQALFDAFLKNLDEGLREMGVGDLSVGKKMRKLGEAVYGRIRSYDAALADPEPRAALRPVIARTVYQGAGGQDGGAAGPAAALAAYAVACVAALAERSLSDVVSCDLRWPEANPEVSDV